MGMQHNFKTVQYGNETLVSSFPTLENYNDVHDFVSRTSFGSIGMGSNSTSGSTSGSTSNENPIVGVGSGASIDLAKTCYLKNKADNNNHNQPLVLIPSTLGSILASTSTQSLLLDINEEALITNNNHNHNSTSSSILSSLQPNDYEQNIHILIDPNTMAIPKWYKRSNAIRMSQRRDVATMTDASLSSLAIALDAYLSLLDNTNNDNNSSSSGMSGISDKERYNLEQCIQHSILTLQQIVSIYHESDNKNDLTIVPTVEMEMKQNVIQAVLHAGQLLSFGNYHHEVNNNYYDETFSSSSTTTTTSSLQSQRRNISLALSSALLPKYFPHGNWMTFTATLLPAILSCLQESSSSNQQHGLLKDPKIESSMDWLENEFLLNHNTNSHHEWIPSLSSLAEGAPNVNELISKVHHNSAFLNTMDCNSDYLEKVLFLSLDR